MLRRCVPFLVLLAMWASPALVGQDGPGGGLLSINVDRAQEFVYRGTFTEEGRFGSVHFRRAYRVESRVFVLRRELAVLHAGFLTTYRSLDDKEQPPSAKLRSAWFDRQGRPRPEPGVSLQVPLDSLPTVEVGCLPPLPKERLSTRRSWKVFEAGRPAQVWTYTGQERVQGKLCLVLEGAQESAEWKKPRADRSGWRRLDKVWLCPREGVALKVRRVIERREPARTQTTHRNTMEYERESALHYPGQLSRDRQEEIEQANAFAKQAKPLFTQPSQHKKELDILRDDIEDHLAKNPPTPYRLAIRRLLRKVEAARTGKLAVVAKVDERTQPRFAEIGKQAPPFATRSFTKRTPTTPKDWLGKPTVLVFYLPSSVTSKTLLPYLEQLQLALPGKLNVVGMSVDDDAREVLAQRKLLELTIPIADGSGLRQTFQIETTPKFVVLDSSGVVRASILGWGHEIPKEIGAELRHWLDKR